VAFGCSLGVGCSGDGVSASGIETVGAGSCEVDSEVLAFVEGAERLRVEVVRSARLGN